MHTDELSGIPIIGEPGSYADGAEERVLEIIESAADRSSQSDELAAGISDWPTRYHLSRSRSNILRPLAITPGMRVLDVGAGTGVNARYLGELGANVVALEGALPRARAAAARCESLGNVQVICGQLSEYEDPDGFDLIVVIGVLEYAAASTSSDAGAQAFLSRLRSMTRPAGRVAIAIENQLGLKYLLAYSEDHLGAPGVGLEGYPGTAPARTFSRRRLSDLLEASGFPEQCWLYPFPDYKLPTAIVGRGAYELGDATDFVDAVVRAPVRDLYLPRNVLTDDRATHRVLLDAGLGPEIANSFFVVAGGPDSELDELVDPEVLAWLYGDERLQMWLRERRVVLRAGERAIVAELASSHRDARERGWLSQSVLAEAPYANGRTLEQAALEACARHDLGGISQVLQSWSAFLREHAFPAVTGIPHHPFLPEGTTTVLDGRFLDVGLDNFVQDVEGVVHFVDPEWSALGGVDAQIAQTRGLWWFAMRLVTSGAEHPWSPLTTPDELVVSLGVRCGVNIDAATLESWRAAESALQSKVTGGSQAESLEEIIRVGRTSRADNPVPKQLAFTALRREVAQLGIALTEATAELDDSRAAEEAARREVEETRHQLAALLSEMVELRQRSAEAQVAEQQREEDRRRIQELQARAQEADAALVAERALVARQREELEGTRESYRQVLGRRSVRGALSLARLARPLYRVMRRGGAASRTAAEHHLPNRARELGGGNDP